MNRLEQLQAAIQSTDADAWVLYDFRGQNSIAHTLLQLEPNAHCTRRWMVVIPAVGKPCKIVHRMERLPLQHLDIDEYVYSTKDEWARLLTNTLVPYKTLAMEYSPNNNIPVVSKVDAGTIEMIRGLGNTVVSSGNIAQMFTSVLTQEQLAGAREAAKIVRAAIYHGFEFIRNNLLRHEPITEYEVQQQILGFLDDRDFITDTPPIVAIAPNAAMPHYAPTPHGSAVILHDMPVLIDCWAKQKTNGAVFADLTWVGYTSDNVPDQVAAPFTCIANARNAAIALVRERFASNQPVRGYEVDDACRNVITKAGLAEHFIHRTGHNITTEIHGPGVNMDNYETHDNRNILPGMSFSIEPGVYFPGLLGLRTEIDIVVDHNGAVEVPSEPMQHSVLPLLSETWRQ